MCGRWQVYKSNGDNHGNQVSLNKKANATSMFEHMVAVYSLMGLWLNFWIGVVDVR
ncbi:hypothetical protein BofuT4_uP148100.1 [Botrytis cinerea T4]|uniref:Uncharacterized protein n=1 Tax=Botryotinia fuckeliana (strain T4) TaxID=999810 RepID=G2YWW2_BOTF4|nr:hypothetical protein BofuT4_uP148100.1 [Botrytis cinerea T4]